MTDPAHDPIINAQYATHIGPRQSHDPNPLRLGKRKEIRNLTASSPGGITFRRSREARYGVRTQRVALDNTLQNMFC